MDIKGIFGKPRKKQAEAPEPMADMAFPPMPPEDMGMQQPPASPTQNVLELRQQGLDNNQIVQSLTQQGFSPEQINDAMSLADAKGAVELQQPITQPQQAQPPVQPEQAQSMPPPPPFTGGGSAADERIEELAEAIIDEKWKELSKNIDKIIAWKEKTEAKISVIEQEFVDIKKNFESLHSAILGKVSEYDQNIVSLGSEIKAMEKVFQKLLPTFTENVSELSRITKNLPKKK